MCWSEDNLQEGRINSHLIIKAAATLRTLGHLIKATIVRRFPKIPTTIISTVRMAATVSSGRENLEWEEKAESQELILHLNGFCFIKGDCSRPMIWRSGRAQ